MVAYHDNNAHLDTNRQWIPVPTIDADAGSKAGERLRGGWELGNHHMGANYGGHQKIPSHASMRTVHLCPTGDDDPRERAAALGNPSHLNLCPELS